MTVPMARPAMATPSAGGVSAWSSPTGWTGLALGETRPVGFRACCNTARCATERPAGPWSENEGLTLGLAEDSDSGYEGIASLRPAPDGTTVTITLVRTGVGET
jgi:hypothetical protein